LNAAQVGAILRAYHRERPLTDAERELLPEFHLLYNLADTAVDVYEQVRRGTAPEQAVAEWTRDARFRHHLTDTAWRQTLQRAVDAL
jgi:Ser/Thr protein kinase RdoA (MazF antagonist)